MAAISPGQGPTLAEVRRWCLAHGLARRELRAFCREAYLICLSRLLQCLWLERLCAEAVLEATFSGEWQLRLGRQPKLVARLGQSHPGRHFEIQELPWLDDSGPDRAVPSGGALLRALRGILAADLPEGELDALAADFRNSFANLVLNLALGSRLDAASAAIEPACHGHLYYPFPALRVGLALPDIVEASNLTARPLPLPLFDAGGCRFHAIDYADPASCAADWAGQRQPQGGGLLLPVHPWQLKLSPVLREMLEQGAISRSQTMLEMVPLASQRSCRVLASGYDVKLPINVTLTGEHRLLYRLNSQNAPFVSALIREAHRESGVPGLDFQWDAASICWDDPLVCSHLSAIIRQPCRSGSGETVVPALNLWAAAGSASGGLRLDGGGQALETFWRYCLAVMAGPLLLCADWGLAFEPHMQNVYLVLRDGVPVRAILRDLDNTIMLRERIEPLCRRHGIPLMADTWAHMPSPEVGRLRLVHAMFYGHLELVAHALARDAGLAPEVLEGCMQDAWSTIIAQAASAQGRRNLRAMRSQARTVKDCLGMRLRRAVTMSFQRAEPSGG
ncbi:hypothetical protein BI347_17725 [Chromobacterium sphagni]|uniref:Siderophore biosynthesis protein n=1 Tax=Chromobacterium sphagni TaxID=1903179 RepID=A0A1S1WWT1_9NEIS|nr:IucA/IucC family C-terminal-domain containing protein [Chromobacterium sphagni]OHX11505.1 hypothetical protein BI347_17725 [Chromobacterium sphagni]